MDILIFPELAVDHDAFSEIAKWLALHNTEAGLKLVVAGSFHFEHPDGDFVNMAAMLDWQGKVLWRHCKTLPFELPCGQIEKSKNKTKIRKRFGIGPSQGMKERIRTNLPITFFDTPIGRMATMICLDFMSTEAAEILRKIPCDYFWVPAMTPNISKFQTEAMDNFGAKHLVLSAVCASASIGEMLDIKPRPLSFVYAPSKKFKAPVQGTPSGESALIIYEIHKMAR